MNQKVEPVQEEEEVEIRELTEEELELVGGGLKKVSGRTLR